jgi:hypothetical protein
MKPNAGQPGAPESKPRAKDDLKPVPIPDLQAVRERHGNQ